jgi:hypothetical protein
LHKFWQDQLFWSEKKTEWLQTQIKIVSIEDMKKKIEQMKTVAKDAEAKLMDQCERKFDFAKKFREEWLEPLISTLDVISNILKDNVKDRHLSMIASRIGCKISKEDAELTLGSLLNTIKETKKKAIDENIKKAEKSGATLTQTIDEDGNLIGVNNMNTQEASFTQQGLEQDTISTADITKELFEGDNIVVGKTDYGQSELVSGPFASLEK